MHSHTICASIQILPLATQLHPYRWVDEAIAVIKASGINYKVNAFDTVLEGTYPQVMQVIEQVNDQLCSQGCEEWITHLQIQIRSKRGVTADEKTSPHL
jgi:uncharacterized protein YqgV (UPF0045/DUF77 family)